MHAPGILAPDPKCRIMPEFFFDTVFTWLLHQVEIFTNFTERRKEPTKKLQHGRIWAKLFPENLRFESLSSVRKRQHLDRKLASPKTLQKKERFTIESIPPLICTMKSDFECATWDFLAHKLKKMYKPPRFFRTWFFFWFTLWNPAFFSGWYPEKVQVGSTLFFKGGKSTHLFKTKNRVQTKGENVAKNWKSFTMKQFLA